MQHHAHVLFDLIAESPSGLTKAELLEQSGKVYGSEATFTTCSGQDFTFDEIVAFFHEAGKVIDDDQGRMTLKPDNICEG